MIDKIALSKEISFALRHHPEKLGIKLDKNGFVSVDELVMALNKKEKWQDVVKCDIEDVVISNDKQRFEIKNDKFKGDLIRAFYGHSIDKKIEKTESVPPVALYHGTILQTLPLIQKSGLKPMNRQYVHLSATIEMAKSVGGRHGSNVVVLKVDTKSAMADGYKFYLGNKNVWLSDALPFKYIKILGDKK